MANDDDVRNDNDDEDRSTLKVTRFKIQRVVMMYHLLQHQLQKEIMIPAFCRIMVQLWNVLDYYRNNLYNIFVADGCFTTPAKYRYVFFIEKVK